MIFKYIIVCPLVFLAGFVDAIAGGGGFISLPAFMLAGLPAHASIATNKVSSCMGSTVATYKYAKSGFIPWKLAVFSVPMAFIGSYLGSNLALMLSDHTFKILLMFIVPITGAYVLMRKDFDVPDSEVPMSRQILCCMLIALVIGVYDGFYGPGTGIFLILFINLFAHIDLEHANGLTKAINWTTNFSALIVFLINGQAEIVLGIVGGVFNMLGNYLGARQFEKGGSKIARPVILVVLIIFFIKLIYELFIK